MHSSDDSNFPHYPTSTTNTTTSLVTLPSRTSSPLKCFKERIWSLVTCCMTFDNDRGSQSFSTHPLHLQKQNRQLRAAALTAQSRASFAMKNEFNPAMMFDPAFKKSCISELGIAGIGVEPPGIVPSHGHHLHRTRSLWNVSNDEYWARPPPSRPVSMGYVNRVLAMENQHNRENQQYKDWHYSNNGGGNVNYLASMDRRKSFYGQPSSMSMGRRATSMDGLNHFYRYYGPNIVSNHSNHFPPNWSKSSLVHESEDTCNYRDIEL